MRKRLIVLLATLVVAAMTVGTAFAGGGGTKGPGSCGVAPGSGGNISDHAKDPGPNAGPNTSSGWFTDPGAPNTPGQAVKSVCVEGNGP